MVGRTQRRIAVDARDLGGLALGEKGIAQRLRLVGIDPLVEQFAFERAAIVERHGAGRFDRLDAGVGRALVAGAPRDRLAGRLEQRRRPFGEAVILVADARQGAAAGDAAGEGQCRPLQVALR